MNIDPFLMDFDPFLMNFDPFLVKMMITISKIDLNPLKTKKSIENDGIFQLFDVFCHFYVFQFTFD